MILEIQTTEALNQALADHGGHLICQCPEEVYNETDHVRQSNLKHYKHSPAHYQAALKKTYSSSALDVGTAVHIRVLYGEQAFMEQVVEIPTDINRRTNKGKEEFAEWEKKHEGLVKLSLSDYDLAQRIAHNVMVDPVHSKKFTGGFAEVSVFSKIGDVPVKCRLDYWRPDINAIVDLKTTKDPASNFPNTVVKFDYDVQAGAYSSIVERVTGQRPSFIFVVAEKSKPWGVKSFMLDTDWVNVGSNKYMEWLSIHRSCLQQQHWALYDSNIEVISRPPWLTRR